MLGEQISTEGPTRKHCSVQFVPHASHGRERSTSGHHWTIPVSVSFYFILQQTGRQTGNTHETKVKAKISHNND